jgi:murein endopeptidase
MKTKLTLIALMALVMLAMCPAQATQTITMANPDATAQKDIMVYYSNGTLMGVYNTTSIIPTDPNESYIFTLKPQYSNPLDDPLAWLTSLISYANTNGIALFFIAVIIAIALRRR